MISLLSLIHHERFQAWWVTVIICYQLWHLTWASLVKRSMCRVQCVFVSCRMDSKCKAMFVWSALCQEWCLSLYVNIFVPLGPNTCEISQRISMPGAIYLVITVNGIQRHFMRWNRPYWILMFVAVCMWQHQRVIC